MWVQPPKERLLVAPLISLSDVEFPFFSAFSDVCTAVGRFGVCFYSFYSNIINFSYIVYYYYCKIKVNIIINTVTKRTF